MKTLRRNREKQQVVAAKQNPSRRAGRGAKPERDMTRTESPKIDQVPNRFFFSLSLLCVGVC